MNDQLSSEKQLLSRKQFLSVIGATLGGLILSQFFLNSSEKHVTQINSYGSDTYGNKKV